MNGRSILEFIVQTLTRSAERERDRTIRSYRYHVRQVTAHPIRTLFSILFMSVLVGIMYSVAYDSTATLAAVDVAGEDPLAVALAVLPPAPIMLLIFLAMLVIVPISTVLGGVQYERRHGFRR
jgi:hypothetical protein